MHLAPPPLCTMPAVFSRQHMTWPCAPSEFIARANCRSVEGTVTEPRSYQDSSRAPATANLLKMASGLPVHREVRESRTKAIYSLTEEMRNNPVQPLYEEGDIRKKQQKRNLERFIHISCLPHVSKCITTKEHAVTKEQGQIGYNGLQG